MIKRLSFTTSVALTLLLIMCPHPVKAAELLTNGSFESGLTGWTPVNGTNPWFTWQTVSAGFSSGFLAPAAAQHGSFVAYQGVAADAGGTFTLVQQIAVPASMSASLTWRHRFQVDNNSFCNGAACGTATYAVEVLNTSNILLETLYVLVTGPDSVQDTGWQLLQRNMSSYAGHTIRIRFRTTVTASYAGPGQLEIDQVSAQSPSVLVPTAATVSVSGRVLTTDGSPLRNAVVSLGDQDGATRIARTNAFGHFRFDGVESGRNYLVDVSAKGWTFQPVQLNVVDDVSELEIFPL